VKPSLHRGKLIPPTSHKAAVDRVQQLKYEAAKIEKQLVDADALHPTGWHRAATSKLAEFRSEQHQLEAWLAGHAVGKAFRDTDLDFLHKAYDLLLELELACTLTKDQEAFMEALENHCAPVMAGKEGPR